MAVKGTGSIGGPLKQVVSIPVPADDVSPGAPRRSTLAVIPALNEAESIGATLADVIGFGGIDVVVVSDGSTDETAEIARQFGAYVVELPFNLGVGGALQTGFLYAVRHGYDRVLQIDADHQHSVDDIPRLMAALDGGADLVIGSRFGAQGETGGTNESEYEVGFLRRLAMRGLLSMVRRATGQRFTDTTSGFRAFSHDLVVHWASEFPVDYLSDTVEALVNACRDGFVAVEVPVTMRERQHGLPSTRGTKLVYHYLRVALVVVTSIGRRGKVVRSRPDTAPRPVVTAP